MSYGPTPWQQRHWDARAAANFMAGGAGAGLVVTAALTGAPAWLWLVGAALVGVGLFAVWLEIGRPLRAMNVLLHPRRSWMSREAFAAAALFALVVFTAFTGVAAIKAAATALAALFFVYAQGRILGAARGIPAWREPLVVPLIVATGLAEGAGLLLALWVLARAGEAPPAVAAWLFALALAARLAFWLAWRERLGAARGVDPRALAAVDAAGRVFKATTLAALALAIAVLLAPPAPLLVGAWPVAALLALVGGQWFKFTLVLRAAYNQGFALARPPVRGVPRTPVIRQG